MPRPSTHPEGLHHLSLPSGQALYYLHYKLWTSVFLFPSLLLTRASNVDHIAPYDMFKGTIHVLTSVLETPLLTETGLVVEIFGVHAVHVFKILVVFMRPVHRRGTFWSH